MKYGDRNVVYFEMAINAFQKYYSFELGVTGGCEECQNYEISNYNFCPHCGSSLQNNYSYEGEKDYEY